MSASAGRGRGRSPARSSRRRSHVLDDVPTEEIDAQNPMVVAIAETLLEAYERTQQTAGSTTSPVSAPPAPTPNTHPQPHQSSPSRGTFQQTLAGEVHQLRAQAAQAPAALPPQPAPTPAPTPMEADDAEDISDDATVAADNAQRHMVHHFVNQPTSVSASTTSIVPGPRSVSGRASAGLSPTLQQTNPYRAPSLHPRRPVEARYELRINVKPSNKADEELRTALVEYLTKLKEVDPSLVIHPWEDKENIPSQSGSRRWLLPARFLPRFKV